MPTASHHPVPHHRLPTFLLLLLLLASAPRLAAPASTDRAALLAFRATLAPPSRAALASWRGPLSPSWRGVSLHPDAAPAAAPAVAELVLCGLNLTGALPAAPLALLRRLRALDLSANALSGELPCSLPRSLVSLDLSRNALTGAVPTCLPSSLPALRALNLSANLLRLPLSPQLSFPARLAALDLSRNAISGAVPPRIVADPDSSALLLLDLSHNRLSGEIPAGITTIRSLQGLFLSDNQLSGEIPPGIGNLTYLQVLDLSNNRLSGAVPAGLAGCFQLLYLRLGGNRLSGALRPELDALDSLKVLDLSNNKISGEIPLPLAGCRSLEIVDLSGNQISGELSSAVEKWLSLRFLSLAGNQLSGQLPDWMFSFPLLQWLDLSGNKFVGFIPDGGFNVSAVLNGGGGQGVPSEGVLPPQLFVSASVDTMSWQLGLGMQSCAGGIPAMFERIGHQFLLNQIIESSYQGVALATIGVVVLRKSKKAAAAIVFACFSSRHAASPETSSAQSPASISMAASSASSSSCFSSGGARTPAKSNSFVGTEDHVAPEIVAGSGHDHAVDWWGLGVVLYEMLYGRTPFRGRSRRETFRRVLAAPPELPGEPTPLRDLIARLLEKDPRKRLGAHGVRRHAFFRGVDWDRVLDVARPPFIPVPDDGGAGAEALAEAEALDVEKIVHEVFGASGNGLLHC
ncbi:leucine-rich repeat receptor-like protein FASCIATED EAR2 precursor [Panicum miliaceum]|uniref:non-specific serine/threonine protein kinase n=1 Tax=Panicum miliaceum TaxID=4540 RepID=A0A3L6QHR8_PANMI|nr:leucine-rich repeat receptor-like protein FASCIATED EAR2 precursor [Panicum miliaceum]